MLVGECCQAVLEQPDNAVTVAEAAVLDAECDAIFGRRAAVQQINPKEAVA
jgi:hypothetical protein